MQTIFLQQLVYLAANLYLCSELGMKCSVVILNWNGEAMLRRYLPSVIMYTQDVDCEVVVADNGSTDNSLAFLRTQSVRVIQLDKNYGFAEGYNRAIQQVEADYVVLLNSDVEVSPDWLHTLYIYMDAHPEVAAVQPKVLSWQSKEDYFAGKTQFVRFEHAGAAGGMMDMLGYPYCRGRFLSHVEEDHHQYDSIVPIFWATGACLMIRTTVYRETGGLDAFFFAHQEEIDLCWRLQCRGYKLMCVPQSVVYHLGAGTLSYESPRKTYLNFRNNLLMLYKNLPTAQLRRVMFVRFFLDYVAAFQMLFARKPQNFKAVVQARRDYRRSRIKYIGVRRKNLRSAIVPYPPMIAHRSIIVDYYLRGKRS